jgi:hypothetical protein
MVRERRHDATLPFSKNTPYPERKREGKTPSMPSKGSRNTTYERPKRVVQKESLSFILKIYKNYRMKVGRRTRDAVLDLIVLFFNYSKPK